MLLQDDSRRGLISLCLNLETRSKHEIDGPTCHDSRNEPCLLNVGASHSMISRYLVDASQVSLELHLAFYRLPGGVTDRGLALDVDSPGEKSFIWTSQDM